MQLKIYQQNTLSVLRRFLEKCRISGAENAYNKLTNEHELKERLGSLKSLSYVHWDSIPDTPRVCLKVPTGGGKTILAAHAVKIAAETVLEKEYPVVLWFCPSDTIRRQTAEALKNHRHPYRQTLDEQFGIEHVRVFDIDEKFNIMPQDIAGKCCIIVSTIQAFRQSKTDKYKVYAHHENLENHFRVIPKPNDGRFSFANLLAHHRPVMIVDEAHNVLSDLSKETAGRLNPAVILEWTATPQMNNNTLYNVHASELKDEEMIKLPIALVENAGWEQAVDQAIIKRKELEQTAEKENENNYLRPLLLFQAQDKNGEVNVAVLKDYLLNTANIPEHEIAVVTGEQKELDGVNIAEKNCPVRYVITVEALKEGWDCPFAYVLCSLANVKSDTAVLQLLGRVMRMPYAAKRQQKELNKAYAYVVSKHFDEAAQTLVERLIEKGFEKTEAAAAVETVQPFFPNGNLYENQVDLETALAKEIVPPSMMLSGDGRTITFTPETTDDDIAEVCRHMPEKDVYETKRAYYFYKRTETAPSPAKSGAKFIVPRLIAQQNDLTFTDADDAFENFDWKIADYMKPADAVKGFTVKKQGSSFEIDLNGETLQFRTNNQPALPLETVIENWTAANLVLWLDTKLNQEDIPQGEMLDWLGKCIGELTKTVSLTDLYLTRFILADDLRNKISGARENAGGKAFHLAFLDKQSRTMLDWNNGFTFKDGIYDGEAFQPPGKYAYEKHFLGQHKIPAFDSDEEQLCAQVIDQLDSVKYWLRNAANHDNSFSLPVKSGRFYPDFIAELNDGRVLAVEYKGHHLKDTDDTKSKKLIGELWQKQSEGKCVFVLAVGKERKTTVNDIREQIVL